MNMSHKGRALSISEKQMVVHVKHYFDKEKELFLTNKKLDVNNSAFRTALATHLSQVTVWRIMAEYHSNNRVSKSGRLGSIFLPGIWTSCTSYHLISRYPARFRGA